MIYRTHCHYQIFYTLANGLYLRATNNKTPLHNGNCPTTYRPHYRDGSSTYRGAVQRIKIVICLSLFISDRHVGATDEEKENHEKTFKEIGEAYGVLSDAKQKSRYDAGQDLDNSTSSSSYSSNGNKFKSTAF